jgi:two-component system, response regulator, stage 0 sporulation protein F
MRCLSHKDFLCQEGSIFLARGGSIMARILVVDDEEHIRHFYSEELADEGHKVWTTGTGHELLKTIDSLQPEVVVLDIRLVGYDGLDLLQEVRNKHHDLPVILCTAYDTYKDDQKSIAADYYVVKSFDLSELKMAIKRAVEASGSGQATILDSPPQAGQP